MNNLGRILTLYCVLFQETKIYFHFQSFLNTETVQVVEILLLVEDMEDPSILHFQ